MAQQPQHRATARLLRTLRDLQDDGVLMAVYDIHGGEPLGDALTAWRAAGCPGVDPIQRRIPGQDSNGEQAA